MSKSRQWVHALFVVFACSGAATAQVAEFEFNNNLMSTDTDGLSNVSEMTTSLPFMFGGTGPTLLCLPSEWSSTTPQGPFNNSQAFLQFTVTPVNGVPTSFSAIAISTYRGSGTPDTVEFAGVYADQTPGPGGNNFSTLLATADIFPQSNGAGTATLDLSSTAFLQGVTTPVTFRIYFWSDNANAGTSNAEVERVVVFGGCAGFHIQIVDLGPSCGQALDPVLSADPPVLGSTPKIRLASAFPHALLLPFASVGPVQPFMLMPQGCTVYVDIPNMANNLFLLGTFFTDANGDWCLPIPIPVNPNLLGMEFIFQVRLCAPNGPPGPLAPDWSSNGLMLRVGCP